MLQQVDGARVVSLFQHQHLHISHKISKLRQHGILVTNIVQYRVIHKLRKSSYTNSRSVLPEIRFTVWKFCYLSSLSY